MRKLSFTSLCIVFCLLVITEARAQKQALKKLTINLQAQVQMVPGDSIFISGGFNSWNPGNAGYRLVTNGNVYMIILELPAPAEIEFKFTKGSWQKVEVDAKGNDVQNRRLLLLNDTLINCTVENWKDPATVVAARPSFSGDGFITSSLFSSELGRDKLFSIMLPAGYRQSGKRYPVLYMHDGQNLFFPNGMASAEWRVDETLDSLKGKSSSSCIVVAIHNDEHRMQDYSPYLFDRIDSANGRNYISFIVNTLKPFIDKQYRTHRDAAHTSIAGSSLGGLISYYAILHHPEVFGNAGIFSPSFWINMLELSQLTANQAKELKGKLFFYMGEAEGKNYVDDMSAIAEQLGGKSKAIIYKVVDPLGKHNEFYWSKWFPEFLVWVMSDGLNTPVRLN